MEYHEHQVWLMAFHATMSRYAYSAEACAEIADDAVAEYKKRLAKEKEEDASE